MCASSRATKIHGLDPRGNYFGDFVSIKKYAPSIYISYFLRKSEHKNEILGTQINPKIFRSMDLNRFKIHFRFKRTVLTSFVQFEKISNLIHPIQKIQRTDPSVCQCMQNFTAKTDNFSSF